MMNLLPLVLVVLLLVCNLAVAAPKWQIGTPIVTYYAGPDMTDATAKQMAEGNLNVVWCSADQLDNVQRHGLRGMLRDGLLNPATLDDPAKKAELDALIERVKVHPALYAYYLTDEPDASRFPGLGKLVAYLREKDPARMAYINLFPTYASNEQLGNKGDVATAYTEHLQQFVDTVKPDLLSYDHYHFQLNGDSDQYFLNLALIRDAAVKARIPFLNIVQACTWAPDAMRIPHTNEVKWLINTSLAYGAEGISYYVYFYPVGHFGALATADGQPTPLYHGLKQPNRDFVAMAAQVQPLDVLGAYHVGKVPPGGLGLPDGYPFQVTYDTPAQPDNKYGDILLGTFGTGGNPSHVVVTNLSYKAPATITLSGPGTLERFNPSTGNWTSLRDKCAELRLPASGAVLVRVAK